MKYINPDNPKETWVAKGRGRPPKWVTEMKKRMLEKQTRKKIGKKDFENSEASHIKKSREGADDPIAPPGTVLSDGTYRVNGKLTYVGPDFFLYLDEGDRVSKML